MIKEEIAKLFKDVVPKSKEYYKLEYYLGQALSIKSDTKKD